MNQIKFTREEAELLEDALNQLHHASWDAVLSSVRTKISLLTESSVENPDSVYDELNHRYIARRIARGAELRYTAPEALPRVSSSQVLALVDVLITHGVLPGTSKGM